MSLVSVAARFSVNIGGGINDPGGWDTHGYNFKLLRAKLPIYDSGGRHADLRPARPRNVGRRGRGGVERIWADAAHRRFDARWPRPLAECKFALIAGGGLKMGQVAGETDARAENARNRPYCTQDILATLYHVLGIDPSRTFVDFSGRPHSLVDKGESIAALI